MSFEGSIGQEPDFSEFAAGYRDMVGLARYAFESNDTAVVELESGRLLAAPLLPNPLYGAKDGDDHLVVSIKEQPDDSGRNASYRIALHHMTEHKTKAHPSECFEFRTNPTEEDIANHQEEAVSALRVAIEAASGCGWFSETEALLLTGGGTEEGSAEGGAPEAKVVEVPEEEVARVIAFVLVNRHVQPGYDPVAN